VSPIQIRHPRADEAEAAVEVLNAYSRRIYGTNDMTAAELQEFWRAPEVVFPDDMLVAEADGRLVGYADANPHGETSWLDVRGTDPAAYQPLIEAIAERAGAHDTAHLRGWAPEEDSELHDAYAQAGFRPFRHSFRMEIDLAGELHEPVWPDGFTVRTFREGDEHAVYEAHQDSFADTWGFTRDPYEAWAHWNMGEGFQPEHWFLVEEGDQVAAVALCQISETEPDLGWVRIIGVRPAYRRRGLAIALLEHVFAHFARLGLKTLGLGVDAENPTGAVRLYERAGMQVARRDIRFERVTG
jgi:mycothiol synthase